MGSIGANNTSTKAGADFSQGYTNAGQTLREKYRSTQELKDDGFVAVNDWSLSSLLKENNEIASDYQPWNNKTVYFVWDSDFKKWQKAAEKRWK